MYFARVDDETILLAGIDLSWWELLHQIPESSKIGDDSARDRLYPRPTESTDKTFEQDWEDFVQPELKELFQSSIEIVEQDLEACAIEETQLYYNLVIPVKHLPAWINALNQARLALGARYGVTEVDMEGHAQGTDERLLAIDKINLYGQLQEYFMRAADGV